MSTFRDFDELVPRAPKQLPLGGQLFDFPDRVSARTGTLLLAMQVATKELGADAAPEQVLRKLDMTDSEMQHLHDELLGDGHRALVAAGFGHAVGHVVKTLTVWHLYGEEAAQQVWNSLGPTSAPNRAARRSKAPATSTPRRASTAGTTPRKAPAKAARAGRPSPTAGR